MTQLPRMMNSTELNLIRTDGQYSSLYLAIQQPAQVYTALVNQTFTSDDEIAQVTYDTGAGTLASILPGMTLWVSAVGYGQCELGQCRIRKAPTSSIFYLGENSDIPWADDLYLTVMDEFGIWARHLTINSSNVAFMDYDVAYSDQHVHLNPVPCLGARFVPAWLNQTNIPYNSVSITYTGSWTAYGGYEYYSNTTNDHADFTFVGNRIKFNGVTAPNRGKAGVYLDGVLVATVDQYSASGDIIVPAQYDSGIIAQGTHVISVVVTGTHNGSSSGYYVAINGFDVYSNAGGTDTKISFDASNSWVLGSTISGYLWSAPGASATSGLTTATPTITYNAVGLYRVACTVTAANGKTTTGYVYVQVFDYVSNLPISQFELKSCSGTRSDGGWQFDVTMYAQAGLTTVQDRAMVCLFARDFYGTTEQSIGPITNEENIIAIGWIDGESIVEDPDGSTVDFTVKGLGPWLKKLTGFPIGIQNTTKAPSVWTSWQGLTVDDSLYHLFFWQSTIIPVVDVYLTGDTRISAQQYAPGDTSIYDQLTYLLKNTILGDGCSDRFNRFFCEIDEQLTPPASRSTIPTVITLQYNDWRDQLQITRIPVSVTSQVNLSGIAINLPNTPVAYFSLAPGHVFQRWGAYKSQNNMLLSSQAQANQLAAMQLAWDNHQLEFTIDLGGNNRMVDIVPHQFITVPVSASDTPRGFTFSPGTAIVRQVDISFDKSTKDDTNYLQVSWQAENLTTPGNSSNGDIPVSGTTPSLPVLPLPPTPLPPILILPSGPPTNLVMLVLNAGVYYSLDGGFNWMLMIDGIDTNDLGHVFDLVVSPVSGYCFLLVDGFAALTGSSVYCAKGLGQPWTLILNTAQAAELVGLDPLSYAGAAKAIGINMGAPDEICVLVGQRNGGAVNYFCKGSSAGFPTLGVREAFSMTNGSVQGNIVYGNNQWTAVQVGAGLNSNLIEWCDRNAAVTGYNLTLFSAGGTPRLIRGGKDGAIFYGLGQKWSGVSQLSKSTDNGVTLAATGTLQPIVGLLTEYDYVQSSPDGTIVMAADISGVNAKVSRDGGATWNNIGIVANFYCFFCYGTNQMWVAQGQISGSPVVQYSLDAGVTWVDITGDMNTWLTSAWGASIIRAW